MDRRSRGLLAFSFALIFVPAFYLVWVIFMNGPMAAAGSAAPSKIPDTSAPVRQTYTGISAIDQQLVTLFHFFWPVVDGSDPGLSIFMVSFLGDIYGLWSLIMLDGLRPGNRGRLVSLCDTSVTFTTCSTRGRLLT